MILPYPNSTYSFALEEHKEGTGLRQDVRERPLGTGCSGGQREHKAPSRSAAPGPKRGAGSRSRPLLCFTAPLTRNFP